MLTFQQLYDFDDEEPQKREDEQQDMDTLLLYYLGLTNAGMFFGK